MSKHSPGPWKWERVPMGRDLRLLEAGGCSVLRVFPDYEPSPADAALIASAPTLAARLDEALGLLRRFDAHPNLKGLIQLEKDVAAFLAAIDAESAT